MNKEVKKLTDAEIEKRVHEVADENGNISFENFVKLAKEFLGEYSPDNGKSFDEYLARCKDSELKDSESAPETSNADDMPF